MTQTSPGERSTIRFPYGDLDDAAEVAGAIAEQFGRTCSIDQLAAALDQSLSGAFRQKVATAVTFGVVETGHREVTLTDLGVRLADPQTASEAQVEAFLNVPLYSAVFDRYRGARLPADQGLEAELARLGVTPKQASKARQALQRSAEQAGFFSLGRDRLVRPATVKDVEPAAAPTPTPAPTTPAGLVQHPLIVGLWTELPDPAQRRLTPEEQADWLEAAKVNLKLLYGGVASTRAETPVPPSIARRIQGDSET